MSKEIKDLFDNISKKYDFLNHFLSLNIDKHWRADLVRRLCKDKNKNFKILDLCTGTCDLAIEIAEAYPNSHVEGLDFSQKMLDVGALKIQKKGLSIPLHCGDALQLKFEDNSFDYITCAYGFRNLDEPYKGLLEMKRVLKNGGELFILDFFKPENFFTKTFHASYGKFLLPLFGGMISGNRGAYKYLYESIQTFYTIEECQNAFQAAGYQNIKRHHYFGGVSSLITGQAVKTS